MRVRYLTVTASACLVNPDPAPALFLHLTPELWGALWLTLKLAFCSTVFLVLGVIPLAWWLARSKGSFVSVLETALCLPIVLPPTVIGFYLLVLFSPDYALGRGWVSLTGDTLAFSFSGLVIGSIIYSLPYALQPVVSAFRSVAKSYMDAGINLGASPWRAFLRIQLPMSARGIGVGAILSFAHTMGEFGVVMMIGGSIPGRTKVASIALYDEAQKLNYTTAHTFAALLLVIAFVILLAANRLQRSVADP